MPHWSNLTSTLFGNNSKFSSTTSKDKMITPESRYKVDVQLERTASIPITSSEKQIPAPLPDRSIDPSQTLQLPFHESQKAETPFINSLSESLIIDASRIIRTSSQAKLPSPQRTSTRLPVAAVKPRCVPEAFHEKGTWQDGWVTILEVDKETEKENFGVVKKRSTKEWRGSEEVEPLKKKAKDRGRSLWAKIPKSEKVGSNWMPEISGTRRSCN